MVSLSDGLALAVVVSVVLSVATLRRLDSSSAGWGSRLRSRLILGVPWGTLVTVGFVLAVYLFVQDGISDWYDPVTIPFRAWSYRYPLGMVTAPFAHGSAGHLVGNLAGTLVVGSIAEYAWSHYPTDRGSEAFSSLRTNPFVRAFVVVPLAAIVVGLLTSLFAIGYVIGFSGVVFAMAGFALVRYPVATLVGVIGVQGAILTSYRALLWPVVVAEARPSPPSPPWWANIAIQGHALGLFVGLLLAVALFRRREFRPNPTRLWIALVLYGFAQSLWAIYWFRGSSTYVLYRGPGVAIVVALAIVVTLAVTASDRSVLPAALERRLARPTVSRSVRRAADLGLHSAAVGQRVAGRVRSIALGTRSIDSVTLPTRRGSALMVVLVVLAVSSGPAIPANMFSAEGTHQTETNVTVEDYTVSYAEGVENQFVSFVDVSALGESTSIEASGVIVSSEQRHIWTEAVTKRELAFSGQATVDVGGPGWRESVTAIRRGWSATGNDTAYQVWLRPEDGEPRHAFASDPVRADLTIDDRNVTIVPREGRFYFEVIRTDANASATVELPAEGESVEADGIRFVREGRDIYAESNGTRVQVASKEEYQ